MTVYRTVIVTFMNNFKVGAPGGNIDWLLSLSLKKFG
jgi:hypothetical protein